MKIHSIQTGLIKTFPWEGRNVTSAIFKDPVNKEIFLSRTGLEGDRHAERKYHGGTEKAIYSYSVEYYDFWKNRFPDIEFNPGIFGENLCISGYTDDMIKPGDVFQCGQAQIKVTGPRIPCFKLNIRFDRNDMTSVFTEEAKYGVYYRVLEEGMVFPGATFKKIQESQRQYSIRDMALAYSAPFEHQSILNLMVQDEYLSDGMRQAYEKLLRRVMRKANPSN